MKMKKKKRCTKLRPQKRLPKSPLDLVRIQALAQIQDLVRILALARALPDLAPILALARILLDSVRVLSARNPVRILPYLDHQDLVLLLLNQHLVPRQHLVPLRHLVPLQHLELQLPNLPLNPSRIFSPRNQWMNQKSPLPSLCGNLTYLCLASLLVLLLQNLLLLVPVHFPSLFSSTKF